MALTRGGRLGSYELVAPLGAGAMGEVFRAHDPRLKRDVAIKVLPDIFAADPERLARFDREAQTLASLNHPHIAQVYGLETGAADDGRETHAIVMELVEGEDLSRRLERGAIPLDEALPIARQIADALEAAHGRGVIHRDLKPANIKRRPDGTVKVLDFGLAKAMEAGVGSREPAVGKALANSPTITSPAVTRAGIILGTASYMSPEQARGAPVDRRADIWAFGCVLFEMLTGRRTFGGESTTDVLAAVVKDPPDWSALPPTTPEALRRLLARCLAKQPSRRLHDIADARIEIDALIEAPDEVGASARATATIGGRRREAIAWTAAAASLLVAAWLAFAGRSVPAASPRPIERLSLVHRVEGGAVFGAPQISPDGRQVIYSAEDNDGAVRVWLRNLDAIDAKPLAGTEWFRSHNPFWSPDSRDLAFFAAGKLKRMSADGGPARSLADAATNSVGGAWSSSNVILFSPEDASALYQIPADGGTPTPVTALPAGGVWSHLWPSFLPDGRHFLFTARAFNRAFDASDSGIFLGSLDSRNAERLLPDVSSAVYAEPGFILFARGGVLTALPFDARARRITGDAVSLGEKVTRDASYYLAAFSVSRSGVVALRQALPFEDLAEPRWIDRQGAPLGKAGEARTYQGGVAPSPSGRLVAFGIVDTRTGNNDIWISDADGGNLRRPIATQEWEGHPVWSPDETRIAYTASSGSGASLRVHDVKGGETTVLVEPEGQTFVQPLSWSRQGDHLLFHRRAERSQGDLYVWSFASKTATAFIETPADESIGMFSPDGQWVAFVAVEAGGTPEVWGTRFPGRSGRQRLATDFFPLSWGAGGRELVGISSGGVLVAIPITSSAAGISAGAPKVLIEPPHIFGSRFAPVADHSRFLAGARLDPERGVAEIRLVTGLIDRLRERSGRGQ